MSLLDQCVHCGQVARSDLHNCAAKRKAETSLVLPGALIELQIDSGRNRDSDEPNYEVGKGAYGNNSDDDRDRMLDRKRAPAASADDSSSSGSMSWFVSSLQARWQPRQRQPLNRPHARVGESALVGEFIEARREPDNTVVQGGTRVVWRWYARTLGLAASCFGDWLESC